MRRTFSSYGPVDTDINYFVPRTELVERAVTQLVGEVPEKGGHYFTVWASRQAGKSWIMREVFYRIYLERRYHIVKVNLQLKSVSEDFLTAANYIIKSVNRDARISLPSVSNDDEFQEVFNIKHLDKPLILILDEFDSLEPDNIGQMVRVFRNIYMSRMKSLDDADFENPYRLHGVCLIGVRSVLGIENVKGSPFNVQRSMHIPNLTEAEVNEMLRWYERDSSQPVEQAVIDRLFYETRGQPGLTSWFGELLTEQCNKTPEQPITMKNWDFVYGLATQALPDNNILNIISKAKDPAYLPTVLDLFRTEEKTPFNFDDPALNYLYMNGVVTYETDEAENKRYAKFPCPYVQKRLFNRFSGDVFRDIYSPIDHFDDMEDAIFPDRLVMRNILKRYQTWLTRELTRDYFLKDAPRRSDLRVCEAVWHFSLYRYLASALSCYKAGVHPEFPTGNGKVDLIIMRKGVQYAIEVKSYSSLAQYQEAVEQAARYARSLGLGRILLAFFVDAIDDKNRARLEVDIAAAESDVTVEIFFLITG